MVVTEDPAYNTSSGNVSEVSKDTKDTSTLCIFDTFQKYLFQTLKFFLLEVVPRECPFSPPSGDCFPVKLFEWKDVAAEVNGVAQQLLHVLLEDAGGNRIKIGLPRKSILRDYFQENMTSQRHFLLLRIRFPGRPISILFVPDGLVHVHLLARAEPLAVEMFTIWNLFIMLNSVSWG